MTITVNIKLEHEFPVKASVREVFDALSDVPVSAQYFPGVEQLIKLGKDAYRWELGKAGTERFNLQTVYACTYAANRKAGTIVWTPIEGVGNAQISGAWKIADNKTFTSIRFEMHGTLHLPVPALMKMIVAPIAAAENEKTNQQYFKNLTKHFGGTA